jgi:mono/diheme cytochrome c family protein
MASSVIEESDIELLKRKYSLKQGNIRTSIIRGYGIYKGLCANCHGDAGQGLKDIAPPLANSPRVMGKNQQMPINVLLHGLVGPVDEKDYGVMISMKNNDDVWISDVLNYVRMDFGGITNRVSQSTVRKAREKYKDRDESWTIQELEAELLP